MCPGPRIKSCTGARGTWILLHSRTLPPLVSRPALSLSLSSAVCICMYIKSPALPPSFSLAAICCLRFDVGPELPSPSLKSVNAMLGFRAGLEQHGLPLPEFEKPFHLLPLLRPLPGAPFASAPPEAELAYFESHRPARISFRADGVDWIATTHVLPAAYPRMHDDSVSPPSDPVHPLGKGAERAGATPAEIREAQWSLLDEHVQAHPPPTYYPPHSALDAELDAEKRRAARYPQLWTVVERIVPMRSAEEQEALDVQGSTGLTFVATHANGFHKETYEPLYQHLAETLAERRKADPTAPHVDELWSIDSVDSGDAGLLNQHSLGQCISWLDEPRDILNFLRFYLPKASASIADEGRKGGQVPQAQAGKNHTGRRGLKAGASGRANAELKPSWPARQLPRLHADEGL